MSHDEIRAALAAATPGPWQVYESMQADTFVYGPRGILRDDIIAGPTYNRENAHLIANAPTWLAELLAEVDRLREDARAFAEALGFGDGRTEPAATLAQMIDRLGLWWWCGCPRDDAPPTPYELPKESQ